MDAWFAAPGALVVGAVGNPRLDGVGMRLHGGTAQLGVVRTQEVTVVDVLHARIRGFAHRVGVRWGGIGGVMLRLSHRKR